MDFLDIFTWIVLLITIVTVLAVFVFMGIWPGKVACENKHPQAQAIQVASWVALIFGVVAWPFVLVWAYTKPVSVQLSDSDDVSTPALVSKVATLEARVEQLEAGRSDS